MADTITSSAAFATANMKPAASGGENIDAVWGRNIADNTGYLYYRTLPQFGFSAYKPEVAVNTGTWVGSYHFLKQPSFGSLSGSFYFEAGNSSSGFEVLVNGVSVKATNTGAGTASGSFSADISAFTNGNWYPVIVKMKHAANSSAHVLSGNTWCTV